MSKKIMKGGVSASESLATFQLHPVTVMMFSLGFIVVVASLHVVSKVRHARIKPSHAW